MAAALLAIACLIWVLGAGLVGFARARAGHPLLCWFLAAGSLFLAASAAASWLSPTQWSAPLPVFFGLAPLALRLDALTAVFSALIAIVCVALSLYSPGYLGHSDARVGRAYYWVFLFAFVASMSVLLACANAISFLVFWEIMSLSSACLVASDLSSGKSQRAALVYLGATRLASALLAGGFIWFHALSGSWSFSDWQPYSLSAAPAALVLAGLMVKAGIWPFHLWLPYAHTAAPSPVSALMSGVMVKVALYAVIRLFCCGPDGSLAIGLVLLFFGMVSSVWGILFALVQSDLKKMLAYSTIENAGLILAAVGTCICARGSGCGEIGVLALGAALFHTVNHGLFKALLFMGSGSVDCRAQSRDLDQLGGLAARMPVTAVLFLIGSAAIASLPPLNGFASKWLLYQSLFQMAVAGRGMAISVVAVVAIGVLSLVGGLALACFAKSFAVAFLGRPRSPSSARASETSVPMLAGQSLLAVLCLAAGMLAPQLAAAARSVALSAAGQAQAHVPDSFSPLALTCALAAIAAAVYVLAFRRRNRQVRRALTWECGFGQLSARMQTTSESFVQPITTIVAPVLQYKLHSAIDGRDRRHFPEKIRAEVEMVSILETRVYSPLIEAVRWLSAHLVRLQTGSIHLYLLYVLVTLIILLLVGVRL